MKTFKVQLAGRKGILVEADKVMLKEDYAVFYTNDGKIAGLVRAPVSVVVESDTDSSK